LNRPYVEVQVEGATGDAVITEAARAVRVRVKENMVDIFGLLKSLRFSKRMMIFANIPFQDLELNGLIAR
jgi:hypothetical protein